MRWKGIKTPAPGEMRERRVFLWFPKRFDSGLWVWLEWGVAHDTFSAAYGWSKDYTTYTPPSSGSEE